MEAVAPAPGPALDELALVPPLPPRGAKERARQHLPERVVDGLDRAVHRLRRRRIRAIHWLLARFGLNIVKRGDYYSTLPVLADIELTRPRWERPSELVGVHVDVDAMQARLASLAERWEADYQATAGSWWANAAQGFGPGYPQLDARTLYYMLREHRPGAYLEVGSGLSSYYATLAARRNGAEGAPMRVTCIEPHPFEALRTLPGIHLVVDVVQQVPLDRFTALRAGDVLFIDSSHALTIDSDVAYLYLEVLPRLAPGVLVHIHDVPFPFTTPFPADVWLFGERWPVYWNEAMLVQAFLAFNPAFEILLSTPLLRQHDEQALIDAFADYVPVAEDANPPSSLWLRRTEVGHHR